MRKQNLLLKKVLFLSGINLIVIFALTATATAKSADEKKLEFLEKRIAKDIKKGLYNPARNDLKQAIKTCQRIPNCNPDKYEKKLNELGSMAAENLKAMTCPKGSKRNAKLENQLKQAFLRIHEEKSKNLDIKQVRMDGDTQLETGSGTVTEAAFFIVCAQLKDRKKEPKCQYQHHGFQRIKSGGGAWSEWKYMSIGKRGDLFCENVNK